MKNVVVIGAGAVGGYFGAKMAQAGVPVTFLLRPKRYEQLSKNGLQIKSIHGDFSIKPNLIISPNQIENQDVAITRTGFPYKGPVFSCIALLCVRLFPFREGPLKYLCKKDSSSLISFIALISSRDGRRYRLNFKQA